MDQTTLDDIFQQFEKNLVALNAGLKAAGLGVENKNVWGLAAASETLLVWLLSQSIPETYTPRVEPAYERSKLRGDLCCRHNHLGWVEARWWWRGDEEVIVRTLNDLGRKMSMNTVPRDLPKSRVALLFTIDREQHGWTKDDFKTWLESLPTRRKDLMHGWRFMGAARVPNSPYYGQFTQAGLLQSPNVVADGLFAAAFFSLGV
jgi:hypothetical protein